MGALIIKGKSSAAVTVDPNKRVGSEPTPVSSGDIERSLLAQNVTPPFRTQTFLYENSPAPLAPPRASNHDKDGDRQERQGRFRRSRYRDRDRDRDRSASPLALDTGLARLRDYQFNGSRVWIRPRNTVVNAMDQDDILAELKARSEREGLVKYFDHGYKLYKMPGLLDPNSIWLSKIRRQRLKKAVEGASSLDRDGSAARSESSLNGNTESVTVMEPGTEALTDSEGKSNVESVDEVVEIVAVNEEDSKVEEEDSTFNPNDSGYHSPSHESRQSPARDLQTTFATCPVPEPTNTNDSSRVLKLGSDGAEAETTSMSLSSDAPLAPEARDDIGDLDKHSVADKVVEEADLSSEVKSQPVSQTEEVKSSVYEQITDTEQAPVEILAPSVIQTIDDAEPDIVTSLDEKPSNCTFKASYPLQVMLRGRLPTSESNLTRPTVPTQNDLNIFLANLSTDNHTELQAALRILVARQGFECKFNKSDYVAVVDMFLQDTPEGASLCITKARDGSEHTALEEFENIAESSQDDANFSQLFLTALLVLEALLQPLESAIIDEDNEKIVPTLALLETEKKFLKHYEALEDVTISPATMKDDLNEITAKADVTRGLNSTRSDLIEGTEILSKKVHGLLELVDALYTSDGDEAPRGVLRGLIQRIHSIITFDQDVLSNEISDEAITTAKHHENQRHQSIIHPDKSQAQNKEWRSKMPRQEALHKKVEDPNLASVEADSEDDSDSDDDVEIIIKISAEDETKQAAELASKRPCPDVNKSEGCIGTKREQCPYQHWNQGKTCQSVIQGVACEKPFCAFVHTSKSCPSEVNPTSPSAEAKSPVASSGPLRPCTQVNQPEGCPHETTGACGFHHGYKGRVCISVEKGTTCNRGANCAFLHTSPTTGEDPRLKDLKPILNEVLQNLSLYKPCGFMNKKQGCWKGAASCPCNHTLENVPCPDDDGKESCRRGDACPLKHISKVQAAPPPQVSAKAPPSAKPSARTSTFNQNPALNPGVKRLRLKDEINGEELEHSAEKRQRQEQPLDNGKTHHASSNSNQVTTTLYGMAPSQSTQQYGQTPFPAFNTPKGPRGARGPHQKNLQDFTNQPQAQYHLADRKHSRNSISVTSNAVANTASNLGDDNKQPYKPRSRAGSQFQQPPETAVASSNHRPVVHAATPVSEGHASSVRGVSQRHDTSQQPDQPKSLLSRMTRSIPPAKACPSDRVEHKIRQQPPAVAQNSLASRMTGGASPNANNFKRKREHSENGSSQHVPVMAEGDFPRGPKRARMDYQDSHQAPYGGHCGRFDGRAQDNGRGGGKSGGRGRGRRPRFRAQESGS